MRHWFRDHHFRSLLKNSSYLGASQIVAALASVATMAFTGRALGVPLFGLLILIQSYSQAASSLSRFQSWQVIVRYGGRELAVGNSAPLKSAIGFAFGLDLLSGFGGMAIAMALAPFIAPLFGVPRDHVWVVVLYCTIMPTMVAMTPNGILRALDRFDLLSWQGAASPIARAILAGIAFVTHAPFLAYVGIWFGTDLLGDAFMWFLGWRELRRHGLHHGVRPALRPNLPGAWRFAINVNLTASLMSAWGPLARLIVGSLLGPAGAALYRIAGTLADTAQRPIDLLARAFYPEVMRLDFATKKPWKLMIRGSAFAAALGIAALLILLAAGKPLLGLLLGTKFVAAYPVLLVLAIAPLLAMLRFPLPSMLYALDRPGAPLVAQAAGVAVYLAVVAPLASRFSIPGAAAAYVIGNAAMTLVLATQVLREYRKARAR